jgi:hypothetical protein
MKELFSEKEFTPDQLYIQILHVVSDDPNCKISSVVDKLIAEHGEYAVRSRVRQLVLRRYLFEGRSSTEILLSITGKGRGLLQKTAS